MLKWYIIAPFVILLIFIYMFIQSIIYKPRYYNLKYGVGLRFFHLTDIHINLLFISAARMRKTIEKYKPDYILISGDFLEKPEDLNKLTKWFKELRINSPVFAIFGNHEHKCFKKNPIFKKEFLKALKELNIRLLINDVMFLQGKDTSGSDGVKKVALVGIDDLKTGSPVNNEIFNGLRDKSDRIIAFSHNPDISLHIPESSVDLLLTGHFHGGQMWMPFKLEYMLLRKDQVSRMGFIKGFATIRENLIYISRGLGTVLVPFRFFSVPEVTVIDI